MGWGAIQVRASDGQDMSMLLEGRFVRWNLGLLAASLVLTPLVTYSLWISDGCEPYLPFISDMDLPPRSGLTFTLGYAICGILMLSFGVQIGILREKWMESGGVEGRWIAWNRAAMASSVLAGFCLFWISFTPWNEHLELHIVQANVIFIGSVFWSVVTTVSTRRMGQDDPRFEEMLPRRVGFSILGLTGLVGMVERFYRFTGLSLDMYALEERLEMLSDSCVNLENSYLSQAAVFEWILAGSMILMLVSFLPEIELLAPVTPGEDSD
jgi:hypothetical protein|tara:strand:- start:8604 stop:9407 length:804 start_codon:yes stop_codon:yes gene_type:complete